METKRYPCKHCNGTGNKVYHNVTDEFDLMGNSFPCEPHDEIFPCEVCKGKGYWTKYPRFFGGRPDDREVERVSLVTGGKTYLTGWL